MHPQDKSILMIGIVGLLVGAFTFYIRRKGGSSRAMAMVASTWSFGATIIAAFIFGVIPIRRSGMGLETIVVPVILGIATAICSAVLGLLTFLIDSWRPSSILSLSRQAFETLKQVDNELSEQARNSTKPIAFTPPVESFQKLPPWKQFAMNSK